MSRRDRTPTDIEVTRVNLADIEEETLAFLRDHAEVDRKHGKDAKTPAKVEVYPAYGVVETPQGLYALCTEGVGPDHPVTDERPLEVDVFVRAYEGDGEGSFISMFPSAQVKLTPGMLRERLTEERVNLAEFVRTFGARLDSNYEGWRRLLSQPVQS